MSNAMHCIGQTTSTGSAQVTSTGVGSSLDLGWITNCTI